MNTAQIKTGKKPWTAEEDTLLMELIELHGIIGNWCVNLPPENNSTLLLILNIQLLQFC